MSPQVASHGTSVSSSEAGLPAELADLLHAIEAHVVSEADAIAAYRQLGLTSNDPLVVRLMRLLLDEEERHHQVFREMASCVRSDVTRGIGYETPLYPTKREVLDALRGFVAQERKGAEQLRTLARCHGVLYGGLFGLLLDLMAMDSEKHASILRFVLKQLGGQEPSATD
jgi:hypothetical protein